MTERESKVQKSCMNIIRRYGGYVYKNAQSTFTEKGRPDLCACIPVSIDKLIELFGKDATVGVFVGIELKREGHLAEVSEAQQIVGRKIQEAHGMWFAIDNPKLVEGLMIKFRG